ncbi:CsbD family protein [Ramlibacter sp.]|uniref:CsbD family protein n=1 Tax=Ramlibacter sp. TaxID=1917967 RepID=UPI003D1376BE
MNKHQVKGVGKDALGKAKETAGQLTGDRELEAKGLAKQAEGKAQKALGDVKEALDSDTPPKRDR